jgi:hypothetical protein
MKEVRAGLALMNWRVPALTLALKPEQLGANPMVSHQSFPRLQQSPFTQADESYLQEVLTECRVRLESALATAKGYSRLPSLATALSHAVEGCQEAIAVVNDPQNYQE